MDLYSARWRAFGNLSDPSFAFKSFMCVYYCVLKTVMGAILDGITTYLVNIFCKPIYINKGF